MNELTQIKINGETYQLGNQLSVKDGVLMKDDTEPITRVVPELVLKDGTLTLDYNTTSNSELATADKKVTIDLNNTFQEDITYSDTGIEATATVPIKHVNDSGSALLHLPMMQTVSGGPYYAYPTLLYDEKNHTLKGYNYNMDNPEPFTVNLYGDNVLKEYTVNVASDYLDEENSEVMIVAGHFNTQIRMNLKFKANGTADSETITGNTPLFTIQDDNMKPYQPCMYWGVLKNESINSKNYMCAIEIDSTGQAKLAFINGLSSSFTLGDGWGIYNIIGTYIANGVLNNSNIRQVQSADVNWDTPDAAVVDFLQKLFKYIYPVNSVIIVDSDVNLRNTETRNNTEWGYLSGTWEKIEDRILYSPKFFTENKEGGRWNNIYPHKHELVEDIVTDEPASTMWTEAPTATAHVLKSNGTVKVGSGTAKTITNVTDSKHKHNFTHTHTISADKFKVEKTKRAEWDETNKAWTYVDITEEDGKITPADILPPYREVAVWIRTA